MRYRVNIITSGINYMRSHRIIIIKKWLLVTRNDEKSVISKDLCTQVCNIIHRYASFLSKLLHCSCFKRCTLHRNHMVKYILLYIFTTEYVCTRRNNVQTRIIYRLLAGNFLYCFSLQRQSAQQYTNVLFV